MLQAVPQATGQLSEWAKALVSAGVGLVAGLAAQPLTHRLTRRLKARDTRNSLYGDLGRLYHILNRVHDLSPPSRCSSNDPAAVADRERAQEIFRASVRTDVFTYYSKGDASPTYWSLPEAVPVASIYEQLNTIILHRAQNYGWDYTIEEIVGVFEEFNRRFKEKTIDEATLLKCRAEHRKRT
jgi:hypothetical protein